jgi:erythromycin esterase-like protein
MYQKFNYSNILKILNEASKYEYVLLGESTHGTKEFYQIRLAITILLVIHYGFNTIFLETEWSNGYVLNQFIHSQLDKNIDVKQLLQHTFHKFPRWMTCNQYVCDLLLFLKKWNDTHDKKVFFYGIDCQDINLAKKNICQKNNLNCPIVKAVIDNYKIMTHPKSNYWNSRDLFWYQVLENTAKYRPSRFILWAHNSHVGNCSANIRNEDHLNIGYLLEQVYNSYIIGFSTAVGEVLAADDWGNIGKVKNINIPIQGSFEAVWNRLCIKKGWDKLIIKCDPNNNTIKYLRYIGVIYNQENEMQAHYIQTAVEREFDVIIFVQKTQALDNCHLDNKCIQLSLEGYMYLTKNILKD